MSLSDQIKQPGQIIGSGGGGGTTDAGDLTTGQVALARGGTNADLSATGGTGHVLKQSSAGAAVTVGALTASDISGLSGVINDAGTTGGTSTAYTATLATRPNPLTSGYTFVCVFHTTNGASPTLSLSGGMPQPLKTNGRTPLPYSLISGTPYLCRSDGTSIHLLSTPDNLYCYGVHANDANDGLYLVGDSVWGSNIQIGGNQAGQGSIDHWLNENAGAKHRFYDKNYVEQLRVDENGVTFSNLAISANVFYRVNNLGFTAVYGGTDYTSAVIRLSGSGDTYPGAHQSFAPLDTRTASTAIALCPVATGDMGRVVVMSTTVASCIANVDSSGTVTLTNLDGGTVDANIVNSSSPTAGQIGIYISAGVLYFKGGSSYAGKMASFSQIGKA